MDNNKDILENFLSRNFEGLKLEEPLFYGWEKGIRFELKAEVCGTDEQLKQALVKKAVVYFDEFFNDNDDILIVNDYNKKVSMLPVLQKDAINVQSYILEQKVDYNGVIHVRARDIAYCQVRDLRLNDLFKAIVDKSYGGEPIGAVYFMRLHNALIFDFFSEVGVDVIASSKEALIPAYKLFSQDVAALDKGRIEMNLGLRSF